MELTVTGQRETIEGVVLEVVPMTLEDYIDMRGTLPDRVSSDEDPAEAGLCSSAADVHFRWVEKL